MSISNNIIVVLCIIILNVSIDLALVQHLEMKREKQKRKESLEKI